MSEEMQNTMVKIRKTRNEYTPPIRGRGRSLIAGAEALRVGSELVQFPLSVCSSHFKH